MPIDSTAVAVLGAPFFVEGGGGRAIKSAYKMNARTPIKAHQHYTCDKKSLNVGINV